MSHNCSEYLKSRSTFYAPLSNGLPLVFQGEYNNNSFRSIFHVTASSDEPSVYEFSDFHNFTEAEEYAE